jgi:hypothetical protein
MTHLPRPVKFLWMISVAFLIAASGTTPIARDIHAYCREQPRCVATQLEAARHVLGTGVLYAAPQAVTEACMRSGKRGERIDWTAALACMRRWAKGRDSVAAKALKRP